jgi:phosphatidylserine decarboxylase
MSVREILFWNRRTRQIEAELVYGEQWLRRGYSTAIGRALTSTVLSSKPFSQAYGAYQSHSLSRKKIAPFIRDFKIDMSEYEGSDFKSFNEFFIRPFRPGKRPFVQDPGKLAAPAEARYFAYDRIREEERFPVKGKFMSAIGLLGDEALAKPFIGGPMLLARLCPTDYHRYHYPDSGKVAKAYTVQGPLHSVNPVALAERPDILVTNERRVAILETQNFGKLAYIEVGALCVGKIVQSHDEAKPFSRGDEKGYFLFGGSTVIVLGEPKAWRPSADLLEQTQVGRETLVRLGEEVGAKV